MVNSRRSGSWMDGGEGSSSTFNTGRCRCFGCKSIRPPDGFCWCGERVLYLTANTDNNPGRKFYRCPKPRQMQCVYFCWADHASFPPPEEYEQQPALGRNSDPTQQVMVKMAELDNQIKRLTYCVCGLAVLVFVVCLCVLM